MLCLICYLAVWPTAPWERPDSSGYLELALDVQDGRQDTFSARSVGYPLLLLATQSLEPGMNLYLSQLLLYFLSVGLLLGLLRDLRVASWWRVAFFALACTPPNVSIAASVLTEAGSAFFLSGAIVALYWWLRKGSPVVLGAACICLTILPLFRPTFQLAFVVLGTSCGIASQFVPVLKQRLWAAALVLVLLPAVLLGAVAARNEARFGYFGLTPLLGLNLSTKTVRVLERLPEEHAAIREILIRHRDADLVARGSSHTGVMSVWHAVPELQKATGKTLPELSEHMLRLNAELVKRAPLEYLVEVGRSAAVYWFPGGSAESHFGSGFLQALWAIVHFAVVGLFFLLVAILVGLPATFLLIGKDVRQLGVRLLHRDRHLLITLFLSLVAIGYNALISTTIEVGNPRYRAPTDLLILLTVVAGYSWLGSLREADLDEASN